MTSSSEKQNDILYQSSKCSDLIFYLMTFVKEFLIAIILIVSLLIVNLKASLSLIALSLFLSLIFYLFSGKKIKRVGEISKEK
jgi:hypothetical protein